MAKEDIYLGIDIGGSGIKAGLVDLTTGEIVGDRFRVDTPQPASPAAIAKAVQEVVEAIDYQGPIGVGFPAIVRKGVALSAANISEEWIGCSIENLLAEALDTQQPIHALNDADAAGLASLNFGAARNHKDSVVLFLTVGTGIGSALFVEGQLVPNTELGHIYLKNHKLGAEAYVSNLQRKIHGWSWGKFGRRLNKYLQHVDFIFSPDVIIVGGGASKSFDRFQSQISLKTPVLPADLLNDAGIIGAALFARLKSH